MQKKEDEGRLLSMPKSRSEQIRDFTVALGMSSIGLVKDEGGVGRPVGSWPDHWIDTIHEEPRGNDKLGARPQEGIDILKAHMGALVYRQGIPMAKDDVSGKELVPEMVAKAREEEMAYFRKLGVYKVVPREHQKGTGGKIIGTRWADVNKGDAESPNCRSRLVGREFNVCRDDTLYAAAPPLKALRLVISHAPTHGNGKNGQQNSIMINGVRRAYFYAKASRDL